MQTSREQLEAELEDAKLLQRLSIELIQEDGIAGLYQKIVEAAVAIMRSQFATIQMLFPDGDNIGKLRLLAAAGFTPEAEKYWEWVYVTSHSSCGEVLRTGKQVIIPEYAKCDFMQGAPALQVFLDDGVFAAQSTPLYSRTGKLIGMISTHWTSVYTPTENQLRLFDVLSRQAADLIDRVQTNEALRQSEIRMRALTTATNDIVYRMSPDWKVMYQLDGRAFLDSTQQPTEDWLKKYIQPVDQENISAAINHAIETQSFFQYEHRVVKADGSIGWVSSRAVPIKDSEGNLVEWFGAASDITDKMSFVSELESKVEERTLELQRSNDDLLQFAHVASHDLKEPVRKIRTFGLRLKQELNGEISEKARTFTDKIMESASRMSTMIEGVLTYSSFNGTEQKLEKVDLNTIIDNIENDLEILIQQKQASIVYNDLPVFDGIEVLIYQLFYNLINNSLKFSRPNELPVVTIDGRTSNIDGVDFAVITVSDNGIGFEEHQSANIFQAFTRLNSKFVYDGTGLGLSLAKKIVERHHGKIEANGKPGVGATFTVTVPVCNRFH